MKTKFLFISLGCIIIGLIIIAGIMSQYLFNLSVDEPVKESPFKSLEHKSRQKKERKEIITETVIDINEIAIKAEKTKEKKTARFIKPVPVKKKEVAKKTKEATVPKTSIAKVISITGTAMAFNGDARPRKLIAESKVHTDDIIETFIQTRLEMLCADGTKIHIGENTKISIDEYSFNKDKPDDNNFLMKSFRGSCRIVTGAITKLNPKRFKVKTKMATIGIRGCDVGFKTSPLKETIYVIELSGPERVLVNASSKGVAVNDIAGNDEKKANVQDQEILVYKPNTKIILQDHKPPKKDNMTIEEVNRIITDTASLEPAQFKLEQKPQGATFIFEGSGAGGYK